MQSINSATRRAVLVDLAALLPVVRASPLLSIFAAPAQDRLSDAACLLASHLDDLNVVSRSPNLVYVHGMILSIEELNTALTLAKSTTT